MSSEPTIPWLDQHQPHDAKTSAQQIRSLLNVLQTTATQQNHPLRILELGCGAGRILLPLACEGYEVTGIDHNADALAACRANLERDGCDAVSLLEQNFLTQPWPDRAFDAILCLGNTFMTVADMDDAMHLLRKVTQHLAPGGAFIIDDLPGEFWPELTEGNWQSGISEDGSMQLIWDARDSVFTLRIGDCVDMESWVFKDDDQLLRLWTSSALSLACKLAGLSEPTVHPGLLVLSRTSDGTSI